MLETRRRRATRGLPSCATTRELHCGVPPSDAQYLAWGLNPGLGMADTLDLRQRGAGSLNRISTTGGKALRISRCNLLLVLCTPHSKDCAAIAK